jgi:hypothetical protein
MSDQAAASRIDSVCAPCLLIAKQSTSGATTTRAAKSVHISGVPMNGLEMPRLIGQARAVFG